MSREAIGVYYALATPGGVMFHQHRLDIYTSRKEADAARVRYNLLSDGEFDGKVMKVHITVKAIR